MKKIIAILLCMVLCFSIAGCATDSTNNTQNTTSTIISPNKTEYGLKSTCVLENLSFTANDLKETKGTDFFKPEAGNIFVGVNFTIENTSNEEVSISSLLQFEAYVDDVKCDYSFNAACAFDDGTLDGSIAPGKKLIGWYAVEVPAQWAELEITVCASAFSNDTTTFLFKK